MRDLTLYDTPLKTAKPAEEENIKENDMSALKMLSMILFPIGILALAVIFLMFFVTPMLDEKSESPTVVKRQVVNVSDKPDIVGAAELILDYYTKDIMVIDGCVYHKELGSYVHSKECPCTVKASGDKANPYIRLIKAYKFFEDNSQYDWIVNNAIYIYNKKGSYKYFH